MKKYLFLVIAALLILPGTLLAQSDTLSREQINRISNSVVMILTLDQNGQPFASGSGTIVSPDGVIYTNRHVLENGMDFAILTLTDIGEPALLTYYASPVQIHPDVDFAVLKIDRDDKGRPIDTSNLNLPTVSLATDQPQIGDRIFVFGYPTLGDSHLVFTSGSITTIENDTLNGQRIPYWYQTDAQISPGNSGGLVVNLNGEMVGIPTKVRAEGETLGRLGGILSLSVIRGALNSQASIPLPLTAPVPVKFSTNQQQPDQSPPNNPQPTQVAPHPNNQGNNPQPTQNSPLPNNQGNNPQPTQSSPLPNNQSTQQQLNIEITSVEHNVTYNDMVGMKVHTRAEAVGYQGVDLRAAVFAFWGDDTPIIANNRATSDQRSPEGQLTVQLVVTPGYDDTVWDDMWFFVPYDSFPEGRTGTFPAYVDAELGLDGEGFTAFSDVSSFNYTYPDQQLIADITNIEFDTQVNRQLGMKIHAHLQMIGYQGQDVRVGAFFYWGDGTPISGSEAPVDNQTPTDGYLTVQDVLTPSYDNSQWDDFWFFVPYSYFPTGLRGDQDAFAEIEIGIDGQGFTSWSQDENFTLSYGSGGGGGLN